MLEQMGCGSGWHDLMLVLRSRLSLLSRCQGELPTGGRWQDRVERLKQSASGEDESEASNGGRADAKASETMWNLDGVNVWVLAQVADSKVRESG